MRLSDQAQLLYNTLTAHPEENWPIVLPFRLSLDPLADMESGIEGVFIVPVVRDYSIDESNRRGSVKQLVARPRIAVIISRPFASRDTAGIDVSSWAEIKNLLDLRELIDELIVDVVPNIASIEAEPPQELAFDKRWFLSVTEFYFDEVQC